jgi:hypothetical protein
MMSIRRHLSLLAWLSASCYVTSATADGALLSFDNVKSLSLHGGLLLPLAGDSWRDTADASPTFAARGGLGFGGTGASVLLEGTLELSPVSTPDEIDLLRIRGLLGGRLELSPYNSAIRVVRAGIGLDTLHSNSENVYSLALEAGGGLWLPVAANGNLLIGGEATLALATHAASDARQGDDGFNAVSLTIGLGLMFRAIDDSDDSDDSDD